MPLSVNLFQDLKYNSPEEQERLQDNYHFKSKLIDGRYGSTINAEKQAPHMKSTRVDGKSYFEDDANIQKLLNEYAGTGVLGKTKLEKTTHKEIIDTKSVIGFDTQAYKETAWTKIHHSKGRIHAVSYTLKKG